MSHSEDRPDFNGRAGEPDGRRPGPGLRPTAPQPLNALERLVFSLWPSARGSPRSAMLKKAPLPVLRMASLLRQPYLTERLMERPRVVPWRLAMLARRRPDGRELAIAFGFEYLKRRLLRALLPQYRFVFLPFGRTPAAIEGMISGAGPFTAFVWSYRDEAGGLGAAAWRGNPVVRVEDGFIRSVGLGSDGALPWSLCIDRSGLYFDATAPSDLETIAETFDFAAEPALLERADAMMERIRRTGISKYNLRETPAAAAVPIRGGPGGKRRILVIGQVEDDQSILRNRCAIATNEELLERAIADNPGADIVFRPHPDVASGNRPALSNPERLLPAYRPAPYGEPIRAALDGCDEVYTISSLTGFEALLRGKRVRTFGGAFYAGWGLTDDALAFPRRTRRLALRELFAAAYLLYPAYFDPETGTPLEAEDVLDRLEAARAGN